MQELLRNAWQGWLGYTSDGKYGVLLLGALCFLWLYGDRRKNRYVKRLTIFGIVTTFLLILPLTAVLLMLYQTRFYDYKWLWSLVPVTLTIALGVTEMGFLLYEGRWKGQTLKPLGFGLFCLALLFLCSGMGINGSIGNENAAMREKTSAILDELTEEGNNHNICVWAPKEILAHIRTLDGRVELLYGRNMWEEALNAYSYDVYDPTVTKLYEWMESLREDAGEAEEAQEADFYVNEGVSRGVSCMIIPKGVSAKLLLNIETAFAEAAASKGSEMIRRDTEGYHIFFLASGIN